ncbi:MAG: acylphosphatase [Desulforhopalus sp.]
MQTTHVRVEGRVQGVFFRDYTRNQALQLHLKGWVRNLRDGSVEAVLHGRKEDIALLLERIHEGSPNSRVDNVHISHHESDEVFTNFEIRY